MELADLERRLNEMEEQLQAGLDEVQHAQRMHASAATRRFEGELVQLRQDLTAVTSRMASQADVQQLRQELESSGGARKGSAPGWQEAADLVPRLMAEMGRLREDVEAHRPGGGLEQGVASLGEAVARLEARETARIDQWKERLAVEAEERSKALDGVRREVANSLDEWREEANQAFEGANQALEGALGGLRTELLAAVDAVRSALPEGPPRDFGPDLERLAERLETLGGRLDRLDEAGPRLEERLEDLDRTVRERLETLGGRLDGLDEAGPRLEERLEDLDRAVRERLETLGGRLDALDEAGPRLEERLEDLDRTVRERLETLGGRLDGLDEAGPRLEERLSDLDRTVRERLETLAPRAGVAEVEQKLEVLQSGVLRVLETRLAGLERALEQRAGEAGSPVEGGVLEALRTRLEALEVGPGAGELEKRTEALVAAATRSWQARLEELERRPLPGGAPAEAGALDELRARLEALERAPSGGRSGKKASGEMAAVRSLEERLGALEVRAAQAPPEGLLARLEALESRLGGASSGPEGAEAPLADVLRRLQAVEARGGATGGAGSPAALGTLARRVEVLESRAGVQAPGAPGEEGPTAAMPDVLRRLQALEARGGAPGGAGSPAALGTLARRVEALESRVGPSGPAAEREEAILKALQRRMDALEARPVSMVSGPALGEAEGADLGVLALRVESLEVGMGVERERVREVFRDLLEEHGLLLKRLESRLTLLLQDFHRLSEHVADRPAHG